MKIPFSIDYKPQIESGEYKVVTGDDRPVRIIAWDKKVFGGRTEIVGLVPTPQGDTEMVQLYCPDGTLISSGWNEKFKLFLVTPKPELSEFEKAVGLEIFDEPFEEKHIKVIKEESAKLLDIAREQFIKDGYVIEKKAFHDAVEKIDDKHKAAMSVEYSLHCKVENGTRHAVMNWNEFQKVAQHFIDCGKAEALKDLPRWRKWGNGACGNSYGHPIALVSGAGGIRFVSVLGVTGETYIMLDDLKKLPGFNEK